LGGWIHKLALLMQRTYLQMSTVRKTPPEMSLAPFPLTPTLSLRERENHS